MNLLRLACVLKDTSFGSKVGSIFFDFAKISDGRGFYVHKSGQCLGLERAVDIVKGFVKKVFTEKIRKNNEIIPVFENFESSLVLGEEILRVSELRKNKRDEAELLLNVTKEIFNSLGNKEKKEKKKFRL